MNGRQIKQDLKILAIVFGLSMFWSFVRKKRLLLERTVSRARDDNLLALMTLISQSLFHSFKSLSLMFRREEKFCLVGCGQPGLSLFGTDDGRMISVVSESVMSAVRKFSQ